MMLETTEARWFWVAENLQGLNTWFAGRSLDGARAPETRTDEYLVLPNCRTAGIKLRNRRLEVKALVADAGEHVFHDGLTGQVQRWVKWSLEDLDLTARSSLGMEPAGSRQVTKSRLLRRYAWTGKPRELSSEHSDSASSCHIELTSISLRHSPGSWVTFGIESHGKDADPIEVLIKTARHFFLKQPKVPDELLKATSLSYPEWLAARE